MTTPADPSRRAFFRRFAGDLIASAAEVGKVVNDLRDQSAAEASSLLRPTGGPAGGPAGPATDAPGAAPGNAADAPASGYRTPFRLGDDDDTLLLVDQRRLPQVIVEVPVRSAPEGGQAIRDRVVQGGPAIGQVAAIALAMTARSIAQAQPHARRAILHGAANALRSARTTPIALSWAVDRVMARYRALGELFADGEVVAAAMWAEAMAIVAETSDAHGRMAEVGAGLLLQPDGRPLQLLTHGHTGALSAGQLGTALGVVQAIHQAERPVHVWIDESRPGLAGARLTAWELRQAGVEHTLLADGAAGSLLAQGRVDAVLVGAERIAANGDVANDVGTYPLAVLAARQGVPFYVVATLATVDPAAADGSVIPIEDRPAEDLAAVAGNRVAPLGTAVYNPASDITPADLVTAFVSESGVARPPYPASFRMGA